MTESKPLLWNRSIRLSQWQLQRPEVKSQTRAAFCFYAILLPGLALAAFIHDASDITWRMLFAAVGIVILLVVWAKLAPHININRIKEFIGIFDCGLARHKTPLMNFTPVSVYYPLGAGPQAKDEEDFINTLRFMAHPQLPQVTLFEYEFVHFRSKLAQHFGLSPTKTWFYNGILPDEEPLRGQIRDELCRAARQVVVESDEAV